MTNEAYVYDDANRLSSVSAVNYTWDNNGNLLDDGVNTYEYDSANRLASVAGPAGSTDFVYNGFGDRVSQTAGGNTTNFTLDINAGLSQVLSDGTNSYLYGLGCIAQTQGSATEYFLGDALGSVRHLTDQGGAITYFSAFDPFGVSLFNNGASQTPYGFTNEYTSQGLVNLRSRYYSTETGWFLTKDSWMGEYIRPLSFNSWNYVEGNPVNYTDPTGKSPQHDAEYQACVSSAKLNGGAQGIKENVCGMISELEDQGHKKRYKVT